MKGWKVFHKVLGIIFIFFGLISYLFPVPGSTVLVVLGFIWLIGREKAVYFLREVLGKKLFEFLKIKRFSKKL